MKGQAIITRADEIWLNPILQRHSVRLRVSCARLSWFKQHQGAPGPPDLLRLSEQQKLKGQLLEKEGKAQILP